MNSLPAVVELLTEYAKPETPLRAVVIYELSGLTQDDVKSVKEIWPLLPTDKRERLMARLVEAIDSDSDLDFVEIGKFAVTDVESTVRRDGVNLLWTCNEPWVMEQLIDRAMNDVSTDVRAAAAAGLGRFVLLGELGDFPDKLLAKAEETLLRLLAKSQPTSEVYWRALESIAYSGRPEVNSLIRQASSQPNIALRASAICAMGRTGDEQWTKAILESLQAPEPELKFEAARASGELVLSKAVPFLIEAYRTRDREIKEAVIWALGEIGGGEAQQFLTTILSDEDDEDLLSEVEDALTIASLATINLETDGQSGDDPN
jgi:HEAT repeat protein